jgi:hypothetical protein
VGFYWLTREAARSRFAAMSRQVIPPLDRIVLSQAQNRVIEVAPKQPGVSVAYVHVYLDRGEYLEETFTIRPDEAIRLAVALLAAARVMTGKPTDEGLEDAIDALLLKHTSAVAAGLDQINAELSDLGVELDDDAPTRRIRPSS